jgi:hypothetical protein
MCTDLAVGGADSRRRPVLCLFQALVSTMYAAFYIGNLQSASHSSIVDVEQDLVAESDCSQRAIGCRVKQNAVSLTDFEDLVTCRSVSSRRKFHLQVASATRRL